MTRLPDGPVVLLSGNAPLRAGGDALRPAGKIIEDVDRRRRGLAELGRALRIGQRAQIEQHGNAAPCLLRVDEGTADKGIAQPMGTIGRIGDDMFAKSPGRLEEVMAALTIAAVDQVGGHDAVASVHQHLADGPVATRRLPDIAIELLNGKQSAGCLRGRRVELEGRTSSRRARRARGARD